MTKTKVLRFAMMLLAMALLAFLMVLPSSAAIEPLNPIEPVLASSPLTQGEDPSSPPNQPGGGAGSQDPNINIQITGESSDAVRVVLLLTILSVLPSILLMMTSFTRIIIVFSLLRNALGLQQTPPNQVLLGLALFLSLFIMSPVITEINENAYRPFSDGEIDVEEFLDRSTVPLKSFMLQQVKPEDLTMYQSLANVERPEDPMDNGMAVVVPSFITSEIKRGFTIGFLIFIPFLVIDMVVASALMSMGMMMLPPVTISLPFKLMLFVLVDGWGLLIKSLVQTFHMP